MSKKLHEFINAAVSEDKSVEGQLAIRSDVLQRVNELFNVLSKKVANENKSNQIRYDITDDSDEPLSQNKLLFDHLIRKCSKISLLQCYSLNVPELHKFTIAMFPNLLDIKLDMIPLSTVSGLAKLRHQIQLFELSNAGICDLSTVLIPYITDKKFLSQLKPVMSQLEYSSHLKHQNPLSKFKMHRDDGDIEDSYEWKKLTSLKLLNCGLSRLDESMHMFPALHSLDLSKNQLNLIVHLQDCHHLKYLNLSRNRIKTLSHFGRVLISVTVLNLSHNQIQNLDGLDKLANLEKVDLSNNLIEDFHEIRYLNKLTRLESVNFEDNIFSNHPQYRLMVYNELVAEGSLLASKKYLPHLDGSTMRYREYQSLRGVMFRTVGEEQGGDSNLSFSETDSADNSMSSSKGSFAEAIITSPTTGAGISDGNIHSSSSSHISVQNISAVASQTQSSPPLASPIKKTQMDEIQPPVSTPASSPVKSQHQGNEAEQDGTIKPALVSNFSITPIKIPRASEDSNTLPNVAMSPKFSPAVIQVPSSPSANQVVDGAPPPVSPNNSRGSSMSEVNPVKLSRNRELAIIRIRNGGTKLKEVSSLNDNSRCNPFMLSGWRQRRISRRINPKLIQVYVVDREIYSYPPLDEVKRNVIAAHAERQPKNARAQGRSDSFSMTSLTSRSTDSTESKSTVLSVVMVGSVNEQEVESLSTVTSIADQNSLSISINDQQQQSKVSFSHSSEGNSSPAKSSYDKNDEFQRHVSSTSIGSFSNKQISTETETDGNNFKNREISINDVCIDSLGPNPKNNNTSTFSVTSISGSGKFSRDYDFTDPTVDLPIDIRMSISSKTKQSVKKSSCSGIDDMIKAYDNAVSNTALASSSRQIPAANETSKESFDFLPDFDDDLIATIDSMTLKDNSEELYSGSSKSDSNTSSSSIPLLKDSTSSDRGSLSMKNVFTRPSFSNGTSGASPPVNISESPRAKLKKSTNSSEDVNNGIVRIKNSNPTNKIGVSNANNDKTEVQAISTIEEEEEEDIPDNMTSRSTEVTFYDFGVSSSKKKTVESKSAYIGVIEYTNLSVSDNLELYFQEQVFRASRLNDNSTYIRLPPQKSRFSGSFTENDDADDEDEVIFIKPPSQPERCIALFYEKTVEVTPEAVLSRASTINLIQAVSEVSPSSVSNATLGSVSMKSNNSTGVKSNNEGGFGGGIEGDSSKSSSRYSSKEPSAASSKDKDQNTEVSRPVQELKLIYVITDLKFYIVTFDKLTHASMFGDAPIPILLRSHDIVTLMKCTIFFNFQRCILSFANTASVYNNESLIRKISDFGESTPTNENDHISYMLLTRNKSSTYAIITKVPTVANLARGALDKSLRNVRIENKDADLLDCVIRNVSNLGLDPDIIHYQMLYQTWPNLIGIAIPRTVILASKMILLCDEDLDSFKVNLKILDSANVKDIWKIQNIGDPLVVEFIFKPQSLFAKRRKWVLKCDNRSSSIRLQEDCRRICNESGNNEV